jgi:hypothetical protein
MIAFLLFYRMSWCEERPALMLAGVAVCACLAMWVAK